MNRHTVLARISLLLASILGSINVASGSWLITDGEPGKVSASEKISSDSTKAVCYIKETGVYYTSLDRALEVASSNKTVDTICVIPNLKKADGTTSPVEIKDSHTILSDDSLVLPYEYEGNHIACEWNYTTGKKAYNRLQIHGNKDNNELTFADQDSESVGAYRQTQVVLGDGKSKTELVVNGSLLIGGKIGNPDNTGVNGQTTDSYCELTLSSNSGILCSGSEANIKCDGYIKRDSKGNNSYLHVESGTLTSPIVIYDYRGGTQSVAAVDFNISPFHLFDFPNVQTKVQIDCGAKWIAKACLYVPTGKTFVQKDLVFISPSSSDSPILIQKSGIITVNYAPAKDDGCTKYTPGFADGTKTTIEINNGEVDIGSIKISFESVMDIDSSKFFLPISYRLALTLKSGSVLNCANKVKLMKGSSVTIEEGSTFNLKAPLAIYGSDFIDNSDGKTTVSIDKSIYPSDYDSDAGGASLGAASFVNNGTINVIENVDDDGTTVSVGALGGYVNTTNDAGTAIINYGTKTYSASSEEITNSYTTADNAIRSSCTLTATGNIYNENAKTFADGSFAYNSYKSVSSGNSFGWAVVLSITSVAIETVKEEATTTSGVLELKAVISPTNISDVTYSWTCSVVDSSYKDSVTFTPSVDNTLTITNTSEDAVKINVSVLASNSKGGKSTTFEGEVLGKKKEEQISGINSVDLKITSCSVTPISMSDTACKIAYNQAAEFTIEATLDPDITDKVTCEYTWAVTNQSSASYPNGKGDVASFANESGESLTGSIMKDSVKGYSSVVLTTSNRKWYCVSDDKATKKVKFKIIKKSATCNFWIILKVKYTLNGSENVIESSAGINIVTVKP